MSATVPLWIEALVGALLVASGIASIVAAVGLVRLQSFFMRMHPPALASTFGVWAVALASIAWFSALAVAARAARVGDPDPDGDHRSGDHCAPGARGAVPASGRRAWTCLRRHRCRRQR